jgi:hypothetical protein
MKNRAAFYAYKYSALPSFAARNIIKEHPVALLPALGRINESWFGEVTQLVECHLVEVAVGGSSPLFLSATKLPEFFAPLVEW